MKRPIQTAAIIALISGFVILFMRNTKRDTERDPSRSGSSNRHTLTLSEQHTNTRVARNPRLTLLESLPPGAKVIENKKIIKEVEILLADGTRITARAASVTGRGVNFEAPYTITSRGGLAISSEDGIYSLSRDGSSFKAIRNSTISVLLNDEEPEPQR